MEAAPSFTFDYVVIGGGTAGLALATLLSEDPTVTVAVLEAGKNQDDLDAVKIPGFMGQTQGKPEYDWGFSSTPQTKAGGRVFALYRGKMLGGTSAMNYMAWNRGNKVEQNDWEKLGVQGWDWSSLNTAVTAAERWSPPCHESETVYHGNNDPQNHGRRGYIKNTSHTFHYDLALPFFETMNANGVPTNLAYHSGNPLGVWTSVATIDPETRTRSYVTNAYYLPNKDRNNLVVITDAHVTRVILGDKDEQGLRTAQSVEYIHGEKTSIMHSALEVIMCAGAIQSPQLLEVSGIGDTAVLDRIGVKPLIDLPSVGNNFQDHFSIVASAHLSGTHITGEDMVNNPTFAREQFEAYYKNRSGILSSSMSQFAFLSARNFIPEEELNRMVAIVDEFIASPSVKDSAIAKTFKIQRDWLLDENVAQVDIVLVPGLIPGTKGAAEDPSARHYGLAVILFHPWCRGSVHASTSSSLDQPTIELGMLDSPSDIDAWIMVHALRFVFKCMSTGPLGATTEKIINPTPDKTNEELMEYVHQSAGSSWHFVGSTSMLPKDQGGVVDEKLKVYGTRNLRVVDAGVIPIQMGSNPQASIYGLAHMAAGLISDARMGVMV